MAEVAALRLSDIELSARKGQVTARLDKGMKARTIPLHKLARSALTGYLEVRPAVNDSHFFAGQRGPMNLRGIQLRIEKLGEQAGMKVTPHMLRHTFATRLLRESNADLVTVARLMGHSNVATTAVYAQPTEEDLARAVDGVA